MHDNKVTVHDSFPRAVRLVPCAAAPDRSASTGVAERRETPKTGDKTVAFVEKTREYGGQNPHLVPVFVDMAMFDADLSGGTLLARYIRTLKPLVSAMKDSRMLAGREAYQAARGKLLAKYSYSENVA